MSGERIGGLGDLAWAPLHGSRGARHIITRQRRIIIWQREAWDGAPWFRGVGGAGNRLRREAWCW